MNIVFSPKAILLGALVLLVGYFVSALLSAALQSLGGVQWSLSLAISMAILLPLLSGYMGALFAPANPLINGTLGGFVGTCVFSGVMSAIAAPDSRAIFAGSVIAFTALALGGAFIAVYLWPRHGL